MFSGGTSVQEYDGTTPALSVEYLRGSDYGGGVGGILYTVRSGTPSYTHENKRGDVVAKTDAIGALTYQAQYEAFGKQIATAGSTLDRQKSNSKDTDPTGLVDEGFRYRDLDTGMFITRDPAGFVDGPNLYTYVRQNPWTSFDPEGLDTYNQYQDDLAKNQAALNAYNKANPPKKGDNDANRRAYGKAIARDQAGIDKIDGLVANFNFYSKLAGGPQITQSAKATIDDTGTGGNQVETQGQQQYDALAHFSVGSFVGSNAVTTAAVGVIGKGVGIGVEAAAPYLSKVVGAFFKPALGKVLDADATGFSGVYDSSTGKIGLKPSSYDQPTPEGYVPARGGHSITQLSPSAKSKQDVWFDAEDFAQVDELVIVDVTNAAFDLGDAFSGDIPAEELAFLGQPGLG